MWAISCKLWVWEGVIGKKTYFEPKFQKIFRFNQFFMKRLILLQKIQNVSDIESTFNNSSNSESKFLWRVRYLIDFFYTCEIWIDYFTMHQMLQEIFLWKLKDFWKNLLSKKNSFFESSYSVKTTKLALSCFLANRDSDKFLRKKNLCLEKFEKNQILNQYFYHPSDFNSKN